MSIYYCPSCGFVCLAANDFMTHLKTWHPYTQDKAEGEVRRQDFAAATQNGTTHLGCGTAPMKPVDKLNKEIIDYFKNSVTLHNITGVQDNYPDIDSSHGGDELEEDPFYDHQLQQTKDQYSGCICFGPPVKGCPIHDKS